MGAKHSKELNYMPRKQPENKDGIPPSLRPSGFSSDLCLPEPTGIASDKNALLFVRNSDLINEFLASHYCKEAVV